MRSARILSWCALSSPLTYNTFFSGIRRAVCSERVLLPIPGSPPRRTMLPGTNPPPNTRFSSSSCISTLGSSFADISLSRKTLAAFPPLLEIVPPPKPTLPLEGDEGMLISLKVFHCPQAGHFPIHFADSCPQFSQTYAILSFAISLNCFCKNTKKTEIRSTNHTNFTNSFVSTFVIQNK